MTTGVPLVSNKSVPLWCPIPESGPVHHDDDLRRLRKKEGERERERKREGERTHTKLLMVRDEVTAGGGRDDVVVGTGFSINHVTAPNRVVAKGCLSYKVVLRPRT